jgi:hypothetical protein
MVGPDKKLNAIIKLKNYILNLETMNNYIIPFIESYLLMMAKE